MFRAADTQIVSIFGSPAPVSAQSAIAGAQQSERAALREAEKQKPIRPARRAADGFEADVANVETADAVRNLAGNAEEEAHEDRREHPGYSPSPSPNDTDRPPAIDVQA